MLWAIARGHSVRAVASTDLPLLVLYVGGFTLAGACVGLLWPIHRSAAGSFLLGYIAAAIVSSACGLIVMQLDGSSDGIVPAIVILTVLIGTIVGYQLNKHRRASWP
jgi:4-amino-4-deoxy-L-arabinose transferase-like glycosyltransferase